MDLATWCPISENWDVNKDRFYFTALTHTLDNIYNISLWCINLLEISRLP